MRNLIPYAPLSKEQVDFVTRSLDSWLNVAEGGKRASKNTISTIAFAMNLQTHPDKIHLIGGVTASAAKINILDSNGFGLLHIFGDDCHKGKYEGRECLYVKTKTGEKVVMIVGGGKADDAARIKGNSYGSVYITEANECHQTFIQECIDRTLSSSDRKIFFDLNPKVPSHWFYREFLDYQDKLKADGKNPGYNYGHFTILDNMSLTTKQLKRELAKYDKQSLWYLRDILGKRTAATGRIYTSYDRKTMAVSREWIAKQRFIEFSVGVDVGSTDATCATLTGITTGWKNVVHIDGIYDKQGISEKISEGDYAKQVVKWLSLWIKIYPRISTVYVDSAAKNFRIQLRQELAKHGMNGISVVSFNKDDGINARIELACTLMMQGRYFIAEHLSKWHEAYSSATWDESAYEKGEWERLDNGSYPIDALDSSEYSFYPHEYRLNTVA